MAGFREYKGKEIYYLDCVNYRTIEGLANAVREARAYRRENFEAKGMKVVLILVNITHSFVFGEGLEMLKKSGRELRPITKKRAIIGLNAAKRRILNTFNLVSKADFKAFDDEEKAFEWLVS